jgi:hypothetical protein
MTQAVFRLSVPAFKIIPKTASEIVGQAIMTRIAEFFIVCDIIRHVIEGTKGSGGNE